MPENYSLPETSNANFGVYQDGSRPIRMEVPPLAAAKREGHKVVLLTCTAFMSESLLARWNALRLFPSSLFVSKTASGYGFGERRVARCAISACASTTCRTISP